MKTNLAVVVAFSGSLFVAGQPRAFAGDSLKQLEVTIDVIGPDDVVGQQPYNRIKMPTLAPPTEAAKQPQAESGKARSPDQKSWSLGGDLRPTQPDSADGTPSRPTPRH